MTRGLRFRLPVFAFPEFRSRLPRRGVAAGRLLVDRLQDDGLEVAGNLPIPK
jgi:hypothetical protein